MDLIEEYLPERKVDIMAELTPTVQVARFCNYFADRYLPLDTSFLEMVETEDECYRNITSEIPAPNLSFDLDNDYADIAVNYIDPVKLISFLIECPYNEDGDRQVIGEACGKVVSVELLKRVPQYGFARETLHKYLDGTKYEPITRWADRLHIDTGNFFYDRELTRCGCGGGYIPNPEWSHELVEDLVKDWHKAEKIDADLDKFCKWLSKDYENRFREILDFLLEKESKANGENGSADIKSDKPE